MLCQRCQNLITSFAEDPDLDSDNDPYPHHNRIEDFKASVETGCMICATAWFEYTPDEQQKLEQLAGREFESYGFMTLNFWGDNEDDDDADIEVSSTLGPIAEEITGIPYRSIQFKIHEETLAEKNLGNNRCLLDSRQFSSSTNSPDIFLLANEWIHKCLDKHPSCKEVTASEWYPTRLLSIRSSEDKEESVVCLVETNTAAISEPYMTLSHSWGKGHMITLNKQSYQSLLRGMRVSSLPPTFRDACLIAKNVGVNYLWIDALCIFQDKDDLSDWIAGDNRNSSEPIFRERDPKGLIPPTTEILLRNRFSLPNSIGSAPLKKYVLDYLGYWEPVTKAHINTRGWVMQERSLSPRAIHFGSRQVYWECREIMGSETNPSGFEMSGDGTLVKSLMGAPDGHYSWTNLMFKYTACQLTYPKDKLVAISALARLYTYHLSAEYVAGMWSNYLRNDLLWVVADSDSESRRYKEYTAPTWSWASMNSKTLMRNHGISLTVEYPYEVDGYKLEYITDDKMGAIRSGWLRLRGQLRALKLFRKTVDDESLWSSIIDGIEYDPDWLLGIKGSLRARVWLDEPHLDFEVDSRGGTLYCMLAKRYLSDNDDDEDSCNWDFLLLKQVEDAHGTFQRIGVARTDTGNVKNPYPRIDGPGSAALPCVAYEGGVHTIYVI
ncbi:heterokaryon incompatibility [Fusarium longipes]|uniref:Heterokaryon incompatibility n=1 Tax=Fusarium longipes TaxID=694270 RepID=A0A395SKM5_9HYPO|nr:heterokaryon incompatibility [Fusarium longipes]